MSRALPHDIREILRVLSPTTDDLSGLPYAYAVFPTTIELDPEAADGLIYLEHHDGWIVIPYFGPVNAQEYLIPSAAHWLDFQPHSADVAVLQALIAERQGDLKALTPIAERAGSFVRVHVP